MIKNVIFDVNKVLRHLKKQPVKNCFSKDLLDDLKNFDSNKSLSELIKYVFVKDIYESYDLGLISKEHLIQNLSERTGESIEFIAETMNYRIKEENNEIFLPMIDYIKMLRSKNIKTFILSNMGKDLADLLTEWLGTDNFDDIIFSCDVHMKKPNHDIFECALKRFNINASETLFVDDQLENIKQFEKIGVKGFLFDYKKLELQIKLLNQIIFNA